MGDAVDNVNRISLAPKNSVEEPWRVCGAILDPNECYDNHKVRFETVRHVPDIFDSGDFMSITDLKAAYHSLLVQERLARQFGFHWKQLYYILMIHSQLLYYYYQLYYST